MTVRVPLVRPKKKTKPSNPITLGWPLPSATRPLTMKAIQ